VDISGQTNLPSSFDVNPAGSPSRVSMVLHREQNAGAGTLAFIVTDACVEWRTFAGGGPQAWGP
jgi:hypothetical protein